MYKKLNDTYKSYLHEIKAYVKASIREVLLHGGVSMNT